MKTKTTSIAAMSLVLIAGGIVLLTRKCGFPPADPKGLVTAGDAHAGGSPQSNRNVGAGRRDSGADTPSVEHPLTAETDPVINLWLENIAIGFSETSRRLAADLGLDDGTDHGVESVFIRRREALEGLLTRMASEEEGNDPELLNRICALIRHKGLRADLAGVLSAQQLAEFDAREARRQKETIEARAYRDMAEIHSVVRLSDSQKAELLGVLVEVVPQKIEQEEDARAIMSLSYGSLASDLEPSVLRGLTSFPGGEMMTGGTDSVTSSSIFQQSAGADRAARIDREIRMVENVLDESQTARYREYLEGEASW